VSSAGYLWRSSATTRQQTLGAGKRRGLMTLSVNGQDRRVRRCAEAEPLATTLPGLQLG